MKWTKPSQKEPAPNDEYYVRNAGDKYTLWWDHKEKEFYLIEQSCSMTYFSADQYPNIEWLDESESEPLYTEKEVLMFSEYLFFGYQNVITVKAPRNYISQKDVITLEEPELKYYTQEEIFKFWKSIFIPNKI